MTATVGVSVVLPTYNSAEWLPATLAHLSDALNGVRCVSEIIVVDDGSTDDTQHVLESLGSSTPVPLRVITQTNQGVFSARRNGALEARNETLLFLDSRVLVSEGSLRHLESELRSQHEQPVRVGHVMTQTSTPLVGRFWEVPTYVFWGEYLRRPMLTRITPQNFDRVPKGTGFLLIDKALFLEASAFVGSGGDRFTSDDTKLLRYVVEHAAMVIDPDFEATYQPRTTVKKFLSHAYLRGTLFVDSYFGTSVLRNLILIAITFGFPLALVLMAISMVSGLWLLATLPLMLLVVLVAALTIVAALNRAPARSLLAFTVFVIPFTFSFWTGLTRGFVVRTQSAET